MFANKLCFECLLGIHWTGGAISELCELLTPTDEAAFAATDLELE